MPTFSERSRRNLVEAHIDLQRVMNEAIRHVDFVVIEGYRGRDEQEKAKREGKSNASFGESPHNFSPAYAVDVMPYPNAFQSTQAEWDKVGAAILAAAAGLGVKLTWGKNFKKLVDQPHFELTDWRKLAGR